MDKANFELFTSILKHEELSRTVNRLVQANKSKYGFGRYDRVSKQIITHYNDSIAFVNQRYEPSYSELKRFLKGIRVNIESLQTASCYLCDGVGGKKCYPCEGTGECTCGPCGGIGTITKRRYGYAQSTLETRKYTCHTCKGTRKVSCRECQGRGLLPCSSCKSSGYSSQKIINI